ncbi:bifunctional molybdenum cofactor biosynthesis protein MoaC/MoaB [Compostibacter hankyongensis]|uniref:Bifunctional molybdenum cofactor biosynthesis protein MoaC/MoaB n=1 Tax=Compostibacter hankyongensis TaxID=1007089 RepID=A0ABP8FL30_9BACT
MRDISAETESLRSAAASGELRCSTSTIRQMKEGILLKDNLLGMARSAALLAAKNADRLIPDCHPAGLDALEIGFEEEVKNGAGILSIRASGKSIGRRGPETEVLTAVSIAALVLYDALRVMDGQLEIGRIRLLENPARAEQGGSPRCAILVCSDSTAAGKREDKSGKIISALLADAGAEVAAYKIVPDDKMLIRQQIAAWVEQDIAFVFTTGGTGLGPRDHTVDAVKEMLERDADGITEAMRHYGQQRTPMAMMSRAVAGSIGQTLVITLPGSSAGARESLRAVLPAVFHARKMLKGGGH